MVQLVCSCLNIRIHIKGNCLQPLDITTLNLPKEVIVENFFQKGVAEVVLELGGITKAQSSLCTARELDMWMVTSCAGCGLDVFAITGQESNRVLVSLQLEADPSHVNALVESDGYSKVFKLLLPHVNDNFMQNSFGVEFHMKKPSMEVAVKAIQQQVSNYLKEEQQAMEERIRTYTEQQHANFSNLQQKVRRDKQAMLYLLLKISEKNLANSLAEAIADNAVSPSLTSPISHSSDESSTSSDSALTKSEPAEQMDTHVDMTTCTTRPYPRPHSFTKPLSTQNQGRRIRQVWKCRRVAQSLDAGGIFDMDGVDTQEESAPFYHSDDGDTDDSSTADDATVPVSHNVQQHQYATSLPVNVPVWSPYNHSSGSDEEEKVPVMGDPEQIGASIQALTLSVHDGTEMFGDLPRRRLNTGDLVKSRPI